MSFTLNSLRKGLYPWPVYEAHFEDGTVSRMSFWCRGDRPIDFARGRRLCELSGRHAANKVQVYLVAKRGALTTGFVCLPDGSRVEDPMTTIKASVVRINPKRAAAAALALLQAGDIEGATRALAALAA